MNHNDLTKVLMISSAFFSSILLTACNDQQSVVLKNTDPDDTSLTVSPVPLSANPSSEVRPKYPSKAQQKSEHWQLIWQDEFAQENIDSNKWQFEQNCHGGGNNEQQCYTNSPRNAFIENGVLNIVAIKESFTGSIEHQDSPNYDVNHTRTLPYTSARLRTKNQGDWRYGRIEVNAKLPQGQGTWPAIWMLPTDWVYGGWAASGEIDIMEAVNLGTASDAPWANEGELEYRIKGTLHYGSKWPANKYSGQDFVQQGINPADDFHEYAIEWQEGEIRWYVDDIHFATHTSAGWYSQHQDKHGNLIVGEDAAPFNQKFHLILNVAMGGEWPANTNDKGIDASINSAAMQIDYVRVYQCELNPETGKGCATIGANALYVKGFQPE